MGIVYSGIHPRLVWIPPGHLRLGLDPNQHVLVGPKHAGKPRAGCISRGAVTWHHVNTAHRRYPCPLNNKEDFAGRVLHGTTSSGTRLVYAFYTRTPGYTRIHATWYGILSVPTVVKTTRTILIQHVDLTLKTMNTS